MTKDEIQDSDKLAEALRRIDRARKARADELDLSGLDQTLVPPSVFHLTYLQTLDLSDNQLTQLPEAICQLTQLEILVLSDNQLRQLPETICQLTQLKVLYLDGNQLTGCRRQLVS